ncbi:MAG: ester cyclase [Pseudomonadota bacterium]
MSVMNENKIIVNRYFEEVWNQGKLDVLDEIVSVDYINHSPGMPNPPRGPEGIKPIVTAIREAFPDLKYVIENLVVSEDQVAIRTTMYGTHLGDFFGLAPTGKTIKVTQMQIERIDNGKIVEHWRVTDDLTMMRQLGQMT